MAKYRIKHFFLKNLLKKIPKKTTLLILLGAPRHMYVNLLLIKYIDL